jgi:hypothetical protein
MDEPSYQLRGPLANDPASELIGGRLGNSNPSSRWASHSENFMNSMPIGSRAADILTIPTMGM